MAQAALAGDAAALGEEMNAADDGALGELGQLEGDLVDELSLVGGSFIEDLEEGFVEGAALGG